MKSPSAVYLCLLAAFTMAYGWGYRGTVGHEAGAMVPGALLGLVLALGSGRADWYRRAAVAGLFGAIGWAWGGSLSYMEQTLYALSGSFPDVLYGYTMLFFLGALWAGIGGGVLGLAFTEPRSELEKLMRPFAAVCAVFLVSYLYLFFVPSHAEAYETIGVRLFHGGVWLAAILTALVSGAWWLWRPRDRSASALIFWGAIAWWIGYLGFTHFGGLRLAPLHRSEGWGGMIGVLVVLILYLVRRGNRAALLLTLYGLVGGGLAFALAVFIRHPLAVHWGPFQGAWPQWRTAEDSFGFFMAIAIALGALRLLRGGLQPPEEDTPRAPLDAYAAFVILVAINWINFRRHAAPRLALAAQPLGWTWFVLGGVLVTLPVLYILNRYRKGDQQLVPQTSFGKGVVLTLLVMWTTVAGYFVHEDKTVAYISGNLLLWLPAAIGTWLLLAATPHAPRAIVPAGGVPPSDPKWKPGFRYWLWWAVTPVFLLAITGLSVAMQDGPVPGMGRKRFGPDAYWRQSARLMGAWKAVGRAENLEDGKVAPAALPITRIEFGADRDVTVTLDNGATDSTHVWFRKNQYIWLRWHGQGGKRSAAQETPLEFRGQLLYIAPPPGAPAGGFMVFEREGK
ncbi:MAG: hypothetical protein NTY38_25970 [Acidobacteria bacterium]|nr:hypothetical protein [Acidobacteriota bacterium]